MLQKHLIMDAKRLALLKKRPELCDSFDVEALIEFIELLQAHVDKHVTLKPIVIYKRSPHVLACTPVEKIYEMAGTPKNPTPISEIKLAFPNAKRGTLGVTLCRMYKKGLIGSLYVGQGPGKGYRAIFKVPGSTKPVLRGLRNVIESVTNLEAK